MKVMMYKGRRVEILQEGPDLTLMQDEGTDNSYWGQTSLLREISVKKQRRMGWSPEVCQFYKECYEYAVEQGPLDEPFGRAGKMLQAAWREEKNYSFVDPVLSNMSLWGGILEKKGYMVKQEDGRWIATGKPWEEDN